VKISVLIPTLDEQQELPGCLESVRSQRPAAHEILVADAGSSDLTRERAAGTRWVEASRGRGRQLNEAAAQACGDVLLFLHADSRLPEGALAAAATALEDPTVAVGAFNKRWRSSHPLHRSAHWRARLWHRFGAAFGDQAIFLRRSDFEAVGGFREDLRAEDAELVRRLARRGRIVLLDLEVETSARRLQQEGTLRTWLRWWSIWLRELWSTR